MKRAIALNTFGKNRYKMKRSLCDEILRFEVKRKHFKSVLEQFHETRRLAFVTSIQQ